VCASRATIGSDPSTRRRSLVDASFFDTDASESDFSLHFEIKEFSAILYPQGHCRSAVKFVAENCRQPPGAVRAPA